MARSLLVLATDHPVPLITPGRPLVAGRFVGRAADGTVLTEPVSVPDLPMYRDALREGHLRPAPAVTVAPPRGKGGKAPAPEKETP